jgi:hypothetical protein
LYIQDSDQKKSSPFDHSAGGIRIAQVAEARNIEAKDFRIRKTPCSSPLPDIKVPMVNTMVACLRVEHRKLNDLNTQLAYGATRLASDPGAIEANQKVLGLWNDIRQDLWSHL